MTPLEAVLRFGPQPRLPIGGPHHPNSVQVQAVEAAARRQRVSRLMKIRETKKHIAVLERDLTASRASLATLEREAGDEGARALARYKSPAAPALSGILLRPRQTKEKDKARASPTPTVRFAVSPRGSPLPLGARVTLSGKRARLPPPPLPIALSGAHTPPVVAVQPPSTASSRASTRVQKRIHLSGGGRGQHASCCPCWASRSRAAAADSQVELRVSTTARSGGSSTTSIRMSSRPAVSPCDGSPMLYWADCLGPAAFNFKERSPKTPVQMPVAATLVLPKGRQGKSGGRRAGGGRSAMAMCRSPSPH